MTASTTILNETEPDDLADDLPDQETARDDGKQASQASADLERITDHVEDTEIADATIANAVANLQSLQTPGLEQREELEKKLAAVKIKKEDVDLMMKEMEVTKDAAERSLREAGGDVIAALVALTN